MHRLLSEKWKSKLWDMTSHQWDWHTPQRTATIFHTNINENAFIIIGVSAAAMFLETDMDISQ